MQDIYDIVKNIEGIYDSNTSFQVLKDFERVLDELDIYKADDAEYSNSGNYLLIKNNVKVNSDMGSINADKLFFDLKMQKLDIGSFENNNINANIKINEKRF